MHESEEFEEPSKAEREAAAEREQEIQNWIDVFACDTDMTREALTEYLAQADEGVMISINVFVGGSDLGGSDLCLLGSIVRAHIMAYRRKCAEAKADG